MWEMGNGVGDGKCRVGDGKCRVGDGKCRVGDGKWRVGEERWQEREQVGRTEVLGRKVVNEKGGERTGICRKSHDCMQIGKSNTCYVCLL